MKNPDDVINSPRLTNGEAESLPDGFGTITTPPQDLRQQLATESRPCGEGRFAWEWAKGEQAGNPISVYCAEPLCLTTGSCTGPRFVPHMLQYDARGDDRKITPAEAVIAARMGAEQARVQTGRPDERGDQEIADHIARVWQKAAESVKGGSFGPSGG